jgi:hypothetical protein
MISLAVIVRDVLMDEFAKMTLAQRNHASQTLGPDRTYEALRVGVQIWARGSSGPRHAARLMRIKLDENLPADLVADLAALGHDVDTVPGRRTRRSRRSVAVWAATQAAERFLITQDLDFSDVRVFRARHASWADAGSSARAESIHASCASARSLSERGGRELASLLTRRERSQAARPARDIASSKASGSTRHLVVWHEWRARDNHTVRVVDDPVCHRHDL